MLITMICNHFSFTIQHNELNRQTFLPSVIHLCKCYEEHIYHRIHAYRNKQNTKPTMTMIYYLQCLKVNRVSKKSSKFNTVITEKILTWTNISVSVSISVFWIFCNSVRIVTGFMSNFL